MTNAVHPSDALFGGEKQFPIIPTCEHFAGSEKLILKAFDLQEKLGPIFDVTCDCEDGAPAGQEREHAEMIVRLLTSDTNKLKMAGVRIHDYSHPHWKQDVDILVKGVGEVTAYITIPKTTDVEHLREMVDYIQQSAKRNGITREIPLHVLIETHGALRDIWQIAELPWIQVFDFGLMDFVSGHHGAIPASAMRSPGQFEHALLVRAKSELVAAALANGIVPSHNVSLDLKNQHSTYADAFRARNEFGFLRMWSIYPAQIGAIVEALRPEYAEVRDAAAILLAAQKADWGPIQYDGELHDRATYRYFWELLRKAHVTGVAVPEEAEAAFFK
ncbi:MAG: CoA ester lyase [Gammaproteobacteria bacterium]|nr:CoA ester lyase [Gammaproteobacteria bacterium]MCB1850365.1 CoA ester lyase [Gammaproteobacteria bacterium]